jgi:glycosyltransferase involved in cell wall biosynthesis
VPEPTITVVIPARNEASLIRGAMESVARQRPAPASVEAIVVSNGSQDGTADAARVAARELERPDLAFSIIEEEAAGVARAKNLGAAAGSGELIVFMDGDSRMSPGLLAAVAARAASGERAASIRIVADGRDPIDHAFFWVIENGKRLVHTRANMFWCRREMFRQLGGFDEKLNHAEDLDLLVRAKRAGVRVGHLRREFIVTSTRRLHRGPLRFGMFSMFGRWVLGHVGIGREWPY